MAKQENQQEVTIIPPEVRAALVTAGATLWGQGGSVLIAIAIAAPSDEPPNDR